MCKEDSTIFSSDQVVLIEVEHPEHYFELLFKRPESKEFESINKFFSGYAREVFIPIF